jgi:hypothetical protein
MATLEKLARNKFTDPPLSAAEERVVLAASDGTMADCRDLGGSDDPGEGRWIAGGAQRKVAGHAHRSRLSDPLAMYRSKCP